jgi:hypothetical protein
VRILAVEQMQAMPFATQLLAHLGAEVVKVGAPGAGRVGRAAAPAIRDADGRDVGATYLRNNLGKKSIGLDLKHPRGVALLKRLVPHYDVVAENFKPGTMERLGLGYETLAADHPALVYVAVSGFGGLLPTRTARGPPTRWWRRRWAASTRSVPSPAGCPTSVSRARSATSAARCSRRSARSRRSRAAAAPGADSASTWRCSMRCSRSWTWCCSTRRSGSATTASRRGRASARLRGLRRAVRVQVGREHQFERFAAAVGHPEWLGDPRFATREGWAAHLDDVIRPAVERWAHARTKLEASRALAEQGIVAGPSNDAADLLRDPHVARTGW